MRQWVLSLPKWARYFLERQPKAVSAVLHIFLHVVEGRLREKSPGAAEPTPEDVEAITGQVRRRVLRWFARNDLLDLDEASGMRDWDNGRFSVDASVHIAGGDRPGLERLLRYCARPPFAGRPASDRNGSCPVI